MRTIHVLDTGGTIGGIAGPDDPPPEDDRVIDWLREHCARNEIALQAQILCKKDSRALDESDRAALVRAITASDHACILIPHGTFTMPETGVYLLQKLAPIAPRKTVILVGSLVPLGEPGSDAPAALGFALQSFDRAGTGIWIAMSQRLWHPQEVEKDLESGEFVARSTPG